MQITDIISPEKIKCDIKVSSKKGALEELSKILANDVSSLTYTEVFDCINARERLGSTGLGNGIAIPHGRMKEIQEPVSAFIHLSEAVEYDALDQKPVDLMFGLLVPEDSTDEHLQILATLANLFDDKTIIRELRDSHSADEIYDVLDLKEHE